MQKALIFGDLHSCYDELSEFLDLYWDKERKVIFLGDYIDRGPKPIKTLKLLMNLVESRQAICILGNHDDKLRRYLRGNPVKIAGSFIKTVEAIEKKSNKFKKRLLNFLESLPYKLETDELICVHGAYINNYSLKMQRNFALYGEIDGRIDSNGYPIRQRNWINQYEGTAVICHGHINVEEVEIFNTPNGGKVYNLDTGCVFGRKLSALKFPEMEIVEIKAKKVYYERRT